MRTLSALELMDVWEYGFNLPLVQRALELLQAACPELSVESLGELSIGQRDARLLAVREGLWGSRMSAVAVCPECRERLELTLDTRELLARSQHRQPREISTSVGDYSLTFRLPNSMDLIAAAEGNDLESGRNVILRRCLLSAQKEGDAPAHLKQVDVPDEFDQLPEDVVSGVIDCMAEADPLADIQFSLACPSCQNKWRAAFDIVSFLWTEIEAWAWRVLSDVHTLARAYGWGEREILSLSPARRQFYLEMVGA